MNIAIDISPLTGNHSLQHRVRGSGYYLENLKTSLLQYYPQHKYTFFTRGQKIPKNIDLVHYPYFEPFFLTLPLFSKVRTIVTVHDLIPFVFPRHFSGGLKGNIKWQIQKVSLKNTNAIITDSESSKQDIIRFTGIKNSKIHVIYLAPGEGFTRFKDTSNKIRMKTQHFRKKYKLPDKFVLYVGDVTWNKNLPRLIESVKKANIPLVMAGKALIEKNVDLSNPWNKDFAKVLDLIERDNNIIRMGFISSEELVMLYNVATVFAMPSLYEGFGLPVLEAMSSGCPVVTARTGSLQEIAGESAFYVDPYDIDSISDGLKKVFFDQSVQKELIEKGLKQVKKFTWEKTVRETINVYRYVSGFAKAYNF
ncbi:MAG: glycosyltransferase family 4 protein [Candidatus Levybacteria bacterium]|nr:glycosyltransferase family 4 protein [Candidatus Levybacteria bacterium]